MLEYFLASTLDARDALSRVPLYRLVVLAIVVIFTI